jgi:hypothetical protein
MKSNHDHITSEKSSSSSEMMETSGKDVQDATTIALKVFGRVAIFAICLAQALENASTGHPFYGILWVFLAGWLVLPSNLDSKFEVNINTSKDEKPENIADAESEEEEANCDSDAESDDVPEAEPHVVPEPETVNAAEDDHKTA